MDSVWGLRHAFVRVGMAARASLTMANRIATFALLVKYQSTRAEAESAPHTKSNDVCFQYASLLKKEAVKIRNGANPAMNTGITAKPTPLDTAAAVATNGATDHINQLTLLGLVCPLNMERM